MLFGNINILIPLLNIVAIAKIYIVIKFSDVKIWPYTSLVSLTKWKDCFIVNLLIYNTTFHHQYWERCKHIWSTFISMQCATGNSIIRPIYGCPIVMLFRGLFITRSFKRNSHMRCAQISIANKILLSSSDTHVIWQVCSRTIYEQCQRKKIQRIIRGLSARCAKLHITYSSQRRNSTFPMYSISFQHFTKTQGRTMWVVLL